MSQPKLDATKYRWTQVNTCDNPFAGMIQAGPLPVSVGDVRFNEATFESCNWNTSGSIGEYAAVQLADGDVLFCVISGYQFAGTFQSADDIRMRYYRLTPL